MAIRIITATRFLCTRCQYSRTLRAGENVPSSCPVCDNNKQAQWALKREENETRL